MLTPAEIRPVIPLALESVDLPGLEAERGQVRDNYGLSDGRRVVIATDRFNIFNRFVGLIPYKGQVLNQLTTWWFEHTADIVPNHVIDVPEPNITIALTANPLPVAVVVRGFITGVTPASLWAQYAAGQRTIYGMEFPDGLRKNQELVNPIVTAISKEFGRAHDHPLTTEQVIGMGISPALWERIQDTALKLFLRGRQLCILADLILVDINPLHNSPRFRHDRQGAYAQLVYAAKATDVTDVLINGTWVMHDRQLLTLNEEELVSEAQEYARRIDTFLIHREQSILSKLLAIGGAMEQESFEIQTKVLSLIHISEPTRPY